MVKSDLTLVVCCNKNDFYLAKICIASIRYYYPSINIEIVKDEGNGKFNTQAVELFFSVTNVSLGHKRLGWSGAKFHYLYQMPKGKKVLLLDADIVFTGPFLERLQELYLNNDYLVSADFENNPYANWVKDIYFDTKLIENTFPEYKYPGYFFNAGQIFATGGAIGEIELDKYFDRHRFPFWRDLKTFPLVDQSIYNYLLPTLAKQNKLELAISDFMLWSKSKVVSELSLHEISNRSFKGGLIHWAGDLRSPYLKKMERSDILIFFEDYYYRNITAGSFKKKVNRIKVFIVNFLKVLFKKIKV